MLTKQKAGVYHTSDSGLLYDIRRVAFIDPVDGRPWCYVDKNGNKTKFNSFKEAKNTLNKTKKGGKA